MTQLGSNNLSALAALAQMTRSAGTSPYDDWHTTLGLPQIREVHAIRVDKIDLDSAQPRNFTELAPANREALLGLAESIRESGLLNPIQVRPIGDRYQVVAGERRYRAVSQLLKLETIDALIVEATDAASRLVIQLAENMQRADLSDLEIGRSAIRLKTEFKITQQALAQRLGIQPAFISRCVKLAENALAREGLIASANTLATLHAMPQDLRDQVIANARRQQEKITHAAIRTVTESALIHKVEGNPTTKLSPAASPANESSRHACKTPIDRQGDGAAGRKAAQQNESSAKSSEPPSRPQIKDLERVSYLALGRMFDRLMQIGLDATSVEIYIAMPPAMKSQLKYDESWLLPEYPNACDLAV